MPKDNPDIGMVSFRLEAWPHDPGANGEEYESGCLPAVDVVAILRRLANRVEFEWVNPECPWPDRHREVRAHTGRF